MEKICDLPEIYKIDIPLKKTALKNLNCYVIKSKGQSAVIDTGFNTEECKEILMDELKELSVSVENTNLLITHFHSDHVGLSEHFVYPDTTIWMGKTDYDYLMFDRHGEYWKQQDEIFLKEGLPGEELKQSKKGNPSVIYGPQKDFPVHPLRDNDRIKIGDVTLKAIEVPGHTPGHTCFYIEEEKIMFLGDHVLFDITPNIVQWPLVKSSLRKYLNSLDKISQYEVRLALPGHRNLSNKTLEKRIVEIRYHHEKRLAEIKKVCQEKAGLNAYEIAGNLTWSLRGRSWADAPKQQKWFALGETLAHLEYLIEEEQIACLEEKYYLL